MNRISQRALGFSLLELIIALVIGSVLMLAVMQVYVGSRVSADANEGIRTLQENARFSVNALQNAIRMAGYSSASAMPAFDALNSTNSQIVVNLEWNVDCQGGSTAGLPVPGVAVNRYFVDAATQQLQCAGNASAAPEAIVDGVEAMRILYGVDEDDDGTVDRFVKAAQVADFATVSSIRIALLLNSIVATNDKPTAKTHYLFDADFNSNDQLGRQVISTTVLLRNRSS